MFNLILKTEQVKQFKVKLNLYFGMFNTIQICESVHTIVTQSIKNIS